MSVDGSPRAEESSVSLSPSGKPGAGRLPIDEATQPGDEALRAMAALMYGDEYDESSLDATSGSVAIAESVASETGSRLTESYQDGYTSAESRVVHPAPGSGSHKPKRRRRRRRRRKVRQKRASKDWRPVREHSASSKRLPRLSLSRRRDLDGGSSTPRARARRGGRASSFLSDASRRGVSPKRQPQAQTTTPSAGMLSHRSTTVEDKPGKDSIYDGAHMSNHPGPGQYTPAHPAWKDNRKVVMGMKLSETRSFIIEAARRAALTPGAGAHDPSVAPVKPRTRVHSFHKDKRRDIHEQHLRAISNVQGPNTRVKSQFGTDGVGVTRNGKQGHSGSTFSRVKRF